MPIDHSVVAAKMTAVNVVRHRNAIHVMTDGACVSSCGVLLHLSGKANILPAAPAIIVVRGVQQYGVSIAHHAAIEGWTFDDIVEKVVPFARRVPQEIERLIPAAKAFDPSFDLTLVGYSNRHRRLEHYSLAAHNRCHPESGVKAWELAKCHESTAAPGQFEGFECPPPDCFDPGFHGVLLMEAQRKMKFPLDYRLTNPDLHHLIGGFVQLSTVTKDGIASRIIHRWPDKIGEKINPNARM